MAKLIVAMFVVLNVLLGAIDFPGAPKNTSYEDRLAQLHTIAYMYGCNFAHVIVFGFLFTMHSIPDTINRAKVTKKTI